MRLDTSSVRRFVLTLTLVLSASVPIAAQSLYVAPASPTGRPIPFEITGVGANVPFAFDLSLAGTAPGFQIGPQGPVIPLNRPFVYFDLFGASPAFASVFVNFSGTTDASGRALPVLVAPAIDGFEGLVIDGAGAALSSSGVSGIGAVTNAARTVIVRAGPVASGFAAPFPAPVPVNAATRFVAPGGSDQNDGLSPQTAWREVSYAATHIGPGAVVEVADGFYQGPVILQNLAGTAQAPIIFRAAGTNAQIIGSGSTNNTTKNGIFIGSSSYVTFVGLKAFNSQRAGVRISLSHHVSILNCTFGNHQKWGIFTDYADDLLLSGNECFGSIDEHGIYHSNSGDRATITGNFCHDNKASGIQINADPAFLAPIGGYVPDGISDHCLVERNLCVNNGQAGGAAINLASVRNSVFRNNVIVNTLWANSTGIALWDNAAGVQWGSIGNLIEKNTVAYFPGAGRYCITIMNGSIGNVIRDNVLRGGRRGAFAWTPDSLPGLLMDGNLMWSTDGWPVVARDDATFIGYTLAGWQAASGADAHSIQANAIFQAPSTTAPATGDWSLAPGSPGRDQGIAFSAFEDCQGGPRPLGAGQDIGAFER